MAKVAADLDRAQADRAGRVNQRYTHALAPNHQRIGGNRESRARDQRQFDLHIGARQQHTFLVGQGDFYLHGARGRIDRAGSARHFAAKHLAAQFGLRHLDFLAHLDELGIGLRHADVDPQRVGLREQEQRTAAAGINQITDVDIAAQDHSRKWRHDALEAGQHAQAINVGVGCRQIGARLGVIAASLVELLL